METDEVIAKLLREHGRTYADEAGITLRDKPSPLYQLLVLTVLCSIRIKAEIATAAARELFAAGLRTPRAMADSGWQERVDALGRAHYVRYDESTATALGDGAELLLDRFHGDLRKLHEQAAGDTGKLRELVQEVPRIGPVGAADLLPGSTGRMAGTAPLLRRACLRDGGRARASAHPGPTAKLVPPKDLARLAAALVRVSLSRSAAEELRTA